MNMADYLHWDTQGPCSDGYHIPTKTDWENVINAGVALGQWSSSSGDGMRIKLKLPFAEDRRGTYIRYHSGTFGSYWSSTTRNEDDAYSLYIDSSNTTLNISTSFRCYGFSIRPFKNMPLKPSDSWDTIYSGSNGAGIYYNATEGVISISSDGNSRYTIADKNLGATTVYNNGDTLTEDNCGKYYQWGNNYGFPYLLGLSDYSTTRVNANGYGPGNYYNSSKFIYITSSPYDWSSVQNDNLRGGVTDERPEEPIPPTPTTLNKYITKLYHLGKEYIFDERVSTTGINVSPTSINLTKLNQTALITASVIPSNADDKKIIYTSSAPSIVSVSSTGLVKALGEGNATITVKSNEGGFSKSVSVVSSFGWTPGSNTLLYAPLKTNLINQITGAGASSSSGVTFTTVDGVQCAYSNDNYAVYVLDIPNAHTTSCWMKTSWDNDWMIQWTVDTVSSSSPSLGSRGYFYEPYITELGKFGVYNGNTDTASTKSVDTSWHLFTCTHTGNTLNLYIDGTYIASCTVYSSTFKRLQLFTREIISQRFKGYASNLIIENKVRTETEVQNYFNDTAWQYGLAPTPQGELPSTYQEVEYIQSSGTQYIQISSAFNTAYKVVADAQVLSTSGDTMLFGISNSPKGATGVNRHRYGVNINNGTVYMIAGGSDWVAVTGAYTSRQVYTINQNTGIVDSTSKTINYSSYSGYGEGITLFGYKEIVEGGVNYKISAKVYSFKIYNTSGGLLNDLVPCYRKSDNVIGMYDLVNNTFYTNSGSGTFTKGANVN